MVDSLNCFSFQPVLHDWCNKGRGMCYPISGMMHIKEPLLLIGKSSSCGGSRFPLSLSSTIYVMPYNCKYSVLSASLNKTFPSFLIYSSTCSSCSIQSLPKIPSCKVGHNPMVEHRMCNLTEVSRYICKYVRPFTHYLYKTIIWLSLLG